MFDRFKKKETSIEQYVMSTERGLHYGRVVFTEYSFFNLIKKQTEKWVAIDQVSKTIAASYLVDKFYHSSAFFGREQCTQFMQVAVHLYLKQQGKSYLKRVKS